MNWQPIEIAPKDGGKDDAGPFVLLFVPDGYGQFFIAQWSNGAWLPNPASESMFWIDGIPTHWAALTPPKEAA